MLRIMTHERITVSFLHITQSENNYLSCRNAWRLWVEGNDRCYRHPEILPEVRLLAEAYRERAQFANNPHLLETMASVEDEEQIDKFFEKYTTSFDTSERALRFRRYFLLRDSEKFEAERRFKFYNALDDILCPRTLIGWSSDNEKNRRVTEFQTEFLKLIRRCGSNEPDMWVSDRLELGFKNAAYLASAGTLSGTVKFIHECVSLLDKTMEITGKRTLGTSCEWLGGMIWEAEECWKDRSNSPGDDEQRCIYLYTNMNLMTTCYLIFPSQYYEIMTNDSAFDALRGDPEFISLTERVKALIVTRPKKRD